jgi:hypothetical protein
MSTIATAGPRVFAPQLATDLLDNSDPGITLTLDGQRYTGSGILVAVKGQGLVTDVNAPLVYADRWVIEAADYVKAHPAPFYRRHLLGSWVDSTTGSVYLDVVEEFTDRDEAIAAGLERREIALWDAGRGEEIILRK